MRTHRRCTNTINFINPLRNLTGAKNAQAIKAAAPLAKHDLIAMTATMFVRSDY